MYSSNKSPSSVNVNNGTDEAVGPVSDKPCLNNLICMLNSK